MPDPAGEHGVTAAELLEHGNNGAWIKAGSSSGGCSAAGSPNTTADPASSRRRSRSSSPTRSSDGTAHAALEVYRPLRIAGTVALEVGLGCVTAATFLA